MLKPYFHKKSCPPTCRPGNLKDSSNNGWVFHLETTLLFGGTSPNDIKVSGKDTEGQLSIFEYTGNVKGGPPLHVDSNWTSIGTVEQDCNK